MGAKWGNRILSAISSIKPRDRKWGKTLSLNCIPKPSQSMRLSCVHARRSFRRAVARSHKPQIMCCCFHLLKCAKQAFGLTNFNAISVCVCVGALLWQEIMQMRCNLYRWQGGDGKSNYSVFKRKQSFDCVQFNKKIKQLQ